MGIIPELADIVQVRYACANGQGDQIALNVMHYRVSSRTGAGQPLSMIAKSFDDAMFAFYPPLMPSTCIYKGAGATNITGDRTREFASTLHVDIGNGPGTELPQQVSYLVALKTEFAGRSFRGRIFPGFPASGHVGGDGNIDASGIVAITNFAAAIPKQVIVGAAGNIVTLDLVILSRQHNGAPTEFPTFKFVTECVARSALATQRRRGDYGAHNPLPF